MIYIPGILIVMGSFQCGLHIYKVYVKRRDAGNASSSSTMEEGVNWKKIWENGIIVCHFPDF